MYGWKLVRAYEKPKDQSEGGGVVVMRCGKHLSGPKVILSPRHKFKGRGKGVQHMIHFQEDEIEPTFETEMRPSDCYNQEDDDEA